MCWQNTAMSPIEVTQDETVTTDWHNSEPCACTEIPSSSDEPNPWWEADFDGKEFKVSEVQILTRRKTPSYNYDWDYSRGNEVYIGDTLCGTMPDNLWGEWGVITCEEPIQATKIKLHQPREFAMTFCGIKVKGEEVVPLIPTCDWTQEDIWSDGVCVGEIMAYITSFVVIGAFFGFFILAIVLTFVFI